MVSSVQIVLSVLALLVVSSLVVCDRPQHDPKGIPIVPMPIFPCQPYEYRKDGYPTPTNVNQLRPHDIKAVMALGDSMTAAFGATASEILTEPPLIPREDRYLSFSGGGGAMRFTLPNFIHVYNRNSVGGAPGANLPIDDESINGEHIWPILKNNSLLNAALSGAKVQDLQHEVDLLVQELTTTLADQVDFQNDWKLATLLIGANNLCGCCKNESSDQPDTYREVLNDAIQYLYEQIPRVRLNILPMFNISQVYDWAQSYEYCRRMWDTVSRTECDCLTEDSTEQDRQTVNDYAVQYREITKQIALDWQAKNLTDFAVVYQPFTENIKVINGEELSNFDCFHPSALSHSFFAAGLWNSMMLPPDEKPTNTTLYMIEGFDWICPDRDQYLQ